MRAGKCCTALSPRIFKENGMRSSPKLALSRCLLSAASPPTLPTPSITLNHCARGSQDSRAALGSSSFPRWEGQDSSFPTNLEQHPHLWGRACGPQLQRRDWSRVESPWGGQDSRGAEAELRWIFLWVCSVMSPVRVNHILWEEKEPSRM